MKRTFVKWFLLFNGLIVAGTFAAVLVELILHQPVLAMGVAWFLLVVWALLEFLQ